MMGTMATILKAMVGTMVRKTTAGVVAMIVIIRLLLDRNIHMLNIDH